MRGVSAPADKKDRRVKAQDQTSRAAPLTVGLVLAGGQSRRFGDEKAAARLHGQPLLLWAASALRAHCPEIAVSAPPGSQAEALARSHGMAVLADAPGDADGPLAGIRSGLIWAAQRGACALATVPCDGPFLPADLCPKLQAARGSALVATARTPDGLQPLCSVWDLAALPAVAAALAHGAHPPVHAVLRSLDAREVDFASAEAFANINTPDDLAAAHKRPAPPTASFYR